MRDLTCFPSVGLTGLKFMSSIVLAVIEMNVLPSFGVGVKGPRDDSLPEPEAEPISIGATGAMLARSRIFLI